MDNNQKYAELCAQVDEQPVLPNGTRELFDVRVEFEPTQRLERCKKRYHEAEMEWYISRSLNIKSNATVSKNAIWRRVAAPDGHINSNYGWCVFSEANGLQYTHALRSLLADPYTRQSCCIYTRPSIQTEWNDDVNASRDFICTFCTHHFIRDNRLQYIVYMRSNDIDTGLPYDLAWHQYVYERMFAALIETGTTVDNDKLKFLDMGKIIWHASSLHRYV